MKMKLDRTEKLLIGAILILMVLGATGILHFNTRVSTLEEELPPDTAFVMLTTVEAAHYDRDGNLVQRVVKVGDLPTVNFGYLFAAQFASKNAVSLLAEYNETVMKDVTGTLRSINMNPTYQSEVGVFYPRIGWGSGSTAATVDDFELDTKDDWDRVDQAGYFSNSTHMWVKILMTHEFTTAKSINEVALYVNAFEIGDDGAAEHGKTSSGWDGIYGDIIYQTSWHIETGWRTYYPGDLYGRYMIFRDVLPSQLDVPANDSMTITYWIYIKYA